MVLGLDVLRSPLLITGQCTVVHHLRIFVTALTNIEATQVVDGVERGCMLRTPCLLITSQRTLVHHLRVFVATLISLEETQVVDGVECGDRHWAPCLLITNLCTPVN